MLISTTICHRGLVRDQNEDSCISNEQAQLWLVADGVGGNQGGKVASEMAVQTIERRYRQGLSLKEAILEANRIISEAGQEQDQLRGMATTIVAAGFSGLSYQLAWLGDSRAYLLSPEDIQLLSSDHNVANALFQRGDISEDELFNHPGQHELTQALGLMSLDQVPGIKGSLKENQCLLLCTDGLSGVLTDRQILQSYCRLDPRNLKTLKQFANELLRKVLAAGAPDNVSFTLIMPNAPGGHGSSAPAAAEKPGTEPGRLEQSKNKSVRRRIDKAPITWLLLSVVVLIMLFLFFY